MMHTDILELLRTLPLFASADPALLQSTVLCGDAHVVTLSGGESPTAPFYEMLGVVLSGSLQIRSADAERTVVLRSVSRGHVFGAASLFLKDSEPVSRLVAQSECRLLFFSRDAVRRLLGKDPAFLDAYLQFLAQRVHFLNAKIRSFTAGSAERRLALWLCEHAEGGLVRAVSLSALADTLDIGRASLYRALDKLESEGLIARNGRKITLPSKDALLQKYHS